MRRRLLLSLFLLVANANLALAGDVLGVWLHEDGASKVRFTRCGPAVCGTISWLKDAHAAAKVGQQVFFDMTPAGDDAWVGKAFEPSSGKEYSGKMALAGDRLTTAGCIFGGLICKSIVWTRSP